MEKGRVLIAADDLARAEGLAAALRRAGHKVLTTVGAAALEGAPVELVVLDLPAPDGLEVCRGLCSARPAPAVLFVTADVSEEAHLAAFEAGAGGVIVRPVGADLFVARVEAVLRRLPPGRPSCAVPPAPLRVDPEGRRAFVDGREVRLTPGECRLLACLLAEPGRAFSRRELLRAATGGAGGGQGRVVDAHVKQVRRKLGRPGLIQVVRGVGYRLEEG